MRKPCSQSCEKEAENFHWIVENTVLVVHLSHCEVYYTVIQTKHQNWVIQVEVKHSSKPSMVF